MRNLLSRRMKTVALFIGIVLVCSHPASANPCEFDGARVVANQELDTMRGGFITTSGLKVSIGIIKAVVIDNVLQTVSKLNIPQLTKQAIASNNVQTIVPTNSVTTVKSAPAGSTEAPVASTNAVVMPGDNLTPTTVINSQQTDTATFVKNLGGPILVQNSKDGAEIRNVTIIIATANSASMIRAINLSSRISQQMINAIR